VSTVGGAKTLIGVDGIDELSVTMGQWTNLLALEIWVCILGILGGQVQSLLLFFIRKQQTLMYYLAGLVTKQRQCCLCSYPHHRTGRLKARLDGDPST
jgi:hypothetical protein